ncbi:DNA-dependent ATPase fun30 [Tilletia horrida]|nr:DNA-dependent ATPase fun30 [Tilletia horrida]
MPTTPLRPSQFSTGGDGGNHNSVFSSPALTSPADEPRNSHNHKAAALHDEADYTLSSLIDDDEDDEMDEAAVLAERMQEDREERARDADYEDDPSHTLSSPLKDDDEVRSRGRFHNDNYHNNPSSSPDPLLSSSPPAPATAASNSSTQMSAKEVRASQLAQIRAAKRARDMKAASNSTGSARNSPAPASAQVHAQAPSSSAPAAISGGGSDRKRKASGEAGREGKKKVKGDAAAAASEQEAQLRSRSLSTDSTLSSLSDADADGSEDGDGEAGSAPPPLPASQPQSQAAASSSVKTAPSPFAPSQIQHASALSAPSLADAFAAAKGDGDASSFPSSSKLGGSSGQANRVNPEVERTRARRLQSLWPDRSLEQCIEALRRSEWNVTQAMEWLERVKPEGPATSSGPTAAAATGGMRPHAGKALANGHGIGHARNGAAQHVVPSQARPPGPIAAGASRGGAPPPPPQKQQAAAGAVPKRPIPRGAIMLGGAQKKGGSVFSPPAFTPVRPEDIPVSVRASALQELSEREGKALPRVSSTSSSLEDLPSPPPLASSSRPQSNAPSIPPNSGVNLAASALQARRVAEEAERARVQEAKRLAKARRKAAEEEEAAAAAEEEADDGGSGMDEAEREAMQERAALEWFNTCDETAMMDTIGCNAAQAAGIVALRPFVSVDDVNARLGDKKVKGVTPRLFHNCVELMAGYYEVDAILAKCEKVGRMLQDAMADWDPEYLHQIGGAGGGGTGTGTAAGSRAGTPVPPSSQGGSAAAAVAAAAQALAAGVKKAEAEAGVGPSAASSLGGVKRKAWLSEQPAGLAPGVVLKNYQLAGLNWLSLLYERKMSCILADEMGLGKTVQVISFFTHVKSLGIPGPHLVVVPSSVLENWMREFRTFAPDLVIVKYYGSQREREELRMELRESSDFDIMLTTYDMAAGGPNDHAFLRKRGFDACVFDEGHVLKSRKSQKYEKLMRIRAKWRLLLTGTPLQNNLQELVSLLNFIMPAYFSSAEEALAAIFKVKASSQKNELSQQRIVRAKKMMHPFVLRRRKDKVLTELMSKTERIEYCDMTRVQKKLYNETLSRTRAALIEQEASTKTRSASAAANKRKASSTAASHSHVLMDLRKAANHPLLFRTIYTESKIAAFAKDYIQEPDNADENLEHVKEDFAINSDAQLSLTANAWPCTRKHVLPSHEWMNSGKVKALQRLLREIQAQGDRAIIFSQFTTVLDILCVCLDIMGIKFVGFTGQTDVGDRQELVDQFTNDKEISVFLLSTKAGGLGINLVAANWVILFDQDFNPQNDKQAADRAYRIGQTKEVHVVRLISRGTIDEDIFRLGQRKLELENRVAGGGREEEGEEEEEDGAEIEQKVQRSLLTQLRDVQEEAGDDEEEGEGEEGEEGHDADEKKKKKKAA